MAGQNVLTDPLNNADVAQPNWLYGVSQSGAANPFLTARSSSNPSGPGGLPGGGTDAPGSGALQLTNNSGNQGSFVIYNKPINSSAGVSIQFELYAYGGSGADGTSFFLIDGSQSPTTAGAVGGGLGYSSSVSGASGIVGGYLGIGFDEFGNFSTPGYGAGGPGQTPQSIAVRGSEANSYAYLTGAALPTGTTIDSPSATSRSGAKRSVQINLDPQGNLSVYFDPTGTDTFNSSDQVITNYNVTTQNGALPSTFKFGFAASTGGSTNFHAVNNLSVGTANGAYTPLVSFPATTTTLQPNNTYNITATIDAASTQTVTIPLNFAGTAVQGTDYSLSGTSITIAPGQTSGNVVLTDKSATTTSKTLQINLGTPTNAQLSPDASTLDVTLAPATTGKFLDLNWFNPALTTGSAATWRLDGNQLTAGGLFQRSDGSQIQLDPSWKLISANTDFNKDNIPDAVWFNTKTTQTAVWYMKASSNGLPTTVASGSFIAASGTSTPLEPGSGWQLVTVTNKLGSSPELVWENNITGASAIWQLNIDGTTQQATVSSSKLITGSDGNPALTGGAASGWQLIGAGNFGSLGTQDLFWFNTKTTQAVVWQLNGTTITSAGLLQNGSGTAVTAGLGWKPVSIASVDGTGTDEIIWQKETQVAVWALGSNYTVSAKSAILSQPLAAGEQIQAVADVDLNGTLDLLARNVSSNVDTTRIYALDPTTFQITNPTTARYITLAGQTAPLTTSDRRWDIVDAVDASGISVA